MSKKVILHQNDKMYMRTGEIRRATAFEYWEDKNGNVRQLERTTENMYPILVEVEIVHTSTWQDRVIIEKDELDLKIVATTATIEQVEMSAEELALMQDQRTHMQAYSDVLAQRIALFEV